jgi:tetratricopeptide (TPR) repeat protein
MERQRKTRGDREAATAHHQAALRLHSAGRYAEAETRWAEAARADPSWERPYYNLACATALQQRPDDAIAYLELMRDSELDFYRLRKLESDRDLDSLRALPAFAQVVHDVADALLTGTFVRAGADCPTLELDVDGGFVQVCAQQRRVGEWAYADSVLYYHLSREERRDTDEARPINDYRAVAIKRFTAGELCLGRARAKRKWPTARDIGAIRAARPSAVPSGCFQHR